MRFPFPLEAWPVSFEKFIREPQHAVSRCATTRIVWFHRKVIAGLAVYSDPG
jgi:hypothetical protein